MWLICAVSPFLIGTAQAQNPVPTTSDPLPPAALMRYGSARLRHQQPVQAVALAPDGLFIASSARDFTIHIWERATGQDVASLLASAVRDKIDSSQASTPCLHYSPDGKYLAAGRGDGNILVWEVASKFRRQRKFKGSDASIEALAFSPDSSSLASAAGDQVVRLWDLATGKETRNLPLLHHTPALIFSRDGSLLFGGGDDGSIRIWKTADLSPVRTVEANQGSVHDLALSPAGDLLAAAGADKLVRLLDVRPEANPQTAPFYWAGLPGVRLQAMTPIWQALHLATLDREAPKLTGHTGSIAGLSFLSDGNLLSGSGDGSLRLWDVRKQQEIRRASTGSITCMAVDSVHKLLVTGDQDNCIRLWNLDTLAEIDVVSGPASSPRQITFAPDKASLAISYAEGPVRIFDAVTGLPKKNLDNFNWRGISALSPENSDVAVAQKNAIEVFNALRDMKPLTIATQGKPVTALALCTGARLLAYADEERTLSICALATGQVLAHVEELEAPLHLLLISPDAKIVAGSSGNDTLTFWDAASGRELQRVLESGALVTAAAFSLDGSLVAVGYPDGAVRLWRPGTGKLVQLLTGHPGPVRSLAFSADGRMLAVGSWLVARIWELASMHERSLLSELPGAATALAFAPDHATIVVGCSSTQALRYSLLSADAVGKDSFDLEAIWKSLAGEDAKLAFRALAAAAKNPEAALPFLKTHLPPLTPLTDNQVLLAQKAFADLASDRFEARDQAARQLAGFGAAIEPQLRARLEGQSDSELRFRLEALLDKLHAPEPRHERLRGIRCCELLENSATPAALDLLRDLAGGAPGAWLTEEAKAALGRVEKK